MAAPGVSPAAYARACVEALVDGRQAPDPPEDEPYQARAACFVSVKTRSGDLRGCIGTLTPCEPSLGEEIQHNAYAAAFSDPRFYPIRATELGELAYSVDVLSDSEPATVAELDPMRFGVIVSCGHRRGVLLPDLPSVTTAAQQVAIALQKAGISPDERFDLARFTVRRFRETEGGQIGVCWTDESAAEDEVTCAPPDDAAESGNVAAGESAAGAATETAGGIQAETTSSGTTEAAGDAAEGAAAGPS
ncbi:MAG TPA: AmmeMemoRadiSam system protein A, partial [Thermoleophilia bacterium]|nr:AmmeMemoRadiSam system protein A [Thermoleophilia bacterium]